MGMFMQSLSFRRPKDKAWEPLREELTRLLSMYKMDAAQLEREQEAYGLCDPYGDTFGPETELLAAAISKATGDYAVTAQCVGTTFKKDGKFENNVDPERVVEFMKVVKAFRETL